MTNCRVLNCNLDLNHVKEASFFRRMTVINQFGQRILKKEGQE